MNAILLRRQRGQAMSELLIALLALVPVFLAITFLGRYGDLQQSATQASRYAAFQSAMHPGIDEAKLQDQMRARFFLRHDYLAGDGRHLKSNDSAANINDDKALPALWRDLGGAALLAKPDQVSLSWEAAAMGTAAYTKVADGALGLLGKNWDGARLAKVELNLVNRLDQSKTNPDPLKIGAATAAGGNGLGSSGSTGTRNTAAKMVPATLLPGVVVTVIDLAMSLFEPDGPEFGCIKPDVVATTGNTSRLDGAPNNSACL